MTDIIWWWGAISLGTLAFGGGSVLLLWFALLCGDCYIRRVSNMGAFMQWYWQRRQGRIVSEKTAK